MTIDFKAKRVGVKLEVSAGFAEAAKRAWTNVKRHHEYRRAVAQMEMMSYCELRDMGIERYQIPQAVSSGFRAVRKTAQNG